jgi:hypothetical protein
MADEAHPKVRQVSRELKRLRLPDLLPSDVDIETFRNPTGVAMKLANYAYLDSDVDGGLSAGSKVDEEVWKGIAAGVACGNVQPAKAGSRK